MKYILDASVALKWVLPEKETPKAVRLRNAYRPRTHELLAPDVFPAEQEHCELVTADDKLVRNLQPSFHCAARFVALTRLARE
jgi:predicted nucleic acid-binding protein